MVIPLLCEFNSGGFDNKVRCTKGGRVVWTECTSSHWGEPPTCILIEPDNSKEACARRLEYLKGEA